MLKEWYRRTFVRDLDAALRETRTVRVNGVRFIIKKIDVINFLDGSNVLRQSYDIYKTGNETQVKESEKKVRKYFSEILVAGVVSPRLSFKEEAGYYCVDKLFSDWDMVEKLYEHITEFTYGKKKVRPSTSQDKD